MNDARRLVDGNSYTGMQIAMQGFIKVVGACIAGAAILAALVALGFVLALMLNTPGEEPLAIFLACLVALVGYRVTRWIVGRSDPWAWYLWLAPTVIGLSFGISYAILY